MQMDSNYLKSLSAELITAHSSRNDMLETMDAYYQGKWDMPAPMARQEWVHKVVTTDPHDAVRAGTRVLSALTPSIKIHPMLGDEENKRKANEWEQQLKWYFLNASRRRRATVLSDIVMSALLYDMIAVQVTYLPYQKKEEKAIKEMTFDRKMTHGPFVINVVNPQNVYPIESAHGLEGVLATKVIRMNELQSEWGKLAQPVVQSAYNHDSARRAMEWVTVFDYWDNDVRYVWAIPGETRTRAEPISQGGVDILPVYKHNLGWIPWAVRQGGTTLFSESAHRLNPMLYSVFQTGQWETQNIAETLAVSEIISYASAPRGVVSGPTRGGVEMNYGVPGNIAWEKPGHQFRPLNPPQLDTALYSVVDRITSRVDKSTVARILQNADIAPNTAFSTLNLATQTALGALKPYKHLAEQTVSDLLRVMLMWIKQDGETAVGYGVDEEFQSTQLAIVPDEIVPEQLYIDVELKPDVPTDRLQRINAGRILQSMGVSVRRSLEEAGIDDPEQAIEEGYKDEMLKNLMQIEMQRDQAEFQLWLEDERNARALELQQQQAAAAQQGQQQGTPVEGLAQSPNQGGLPAAQYAPEATREQLTGRDRTGQEFG